MTFADRLNEQLGKRGLCGLELSAKLYAAGAVMHPDTVRRWLEGKTEPRMGNALAVCEALGCQLSDLYPEVWV